jgi:hypothetical protein
VTQGTNTIAYINSLVVYATVASRHMLNPMDSALYRLAQLQELIRRVGLEAARVKERGTMEGSFGNESTIWEKQSLVDCSLIASHRMVEMIEQEGECSPG